MECGDTEARDSPKEGRKGAAPLCTKRCTYVHAHAHARVTFDVL